MLMFWFSGSQISIFSIMITMQLIMGPIKAIASVNQGFVQFEHKDFSLLLPKLMFVGINLFLLGIALYKFSVMGVIPVTPLDWAGIISKRTPQQHNQVLL